jgi:hypothetical protein
VSFDSRIRRPALARTAPRRNLTQLFVPSSAGPAAAATGGATMDPWTDVVSRSVELGYRVIDDYVRHGEHAARTVGGTRFASDPLTPPRDAADLALRMTQSFSDLATLWMGMMQMAVPGNAPWGTPTATPWTSWPMRAPPAPSTPAPPPTHSSGHGNGSAPSGATTGNGVSRGAPRHDAPQQGGARRHDAPQYGVARPDAARLDVDLVTLAPCRARVTVELWPEAAAARRLALDVLHGPGEPRRIEVAIRAASAGEVPTLHVRVPAGQVPGTYIGDVIDDDTAVPVGRVMLRIDPP